MRAVYLAEQTSTALPGWAPPALVGAMISAGVAVLLWYLNARREPVKRITWEARTQSSIVSIDRDFQQQVGISYAGRGVSDLCAIKFRMKNSGNRVIKEHSVRFHFPGDSEILESRFSPAPEKEFRASLLEVGTGDADHSMELTCFIGHLEVDQEVSLEILMAGSEAKDWKAHSFNEEGDVQFREKSVERTTSDSQLIVWFLSLVLTLGILPPGLSALTSEGIGGAIGGIIQVGLLVALLVLLPAAVRAFLRELGKARTADSAVIHLNADGGSVIYNARSASVGSARITQKPVTAEAPAESSGTPL